MPRTDVELTLEEHRWIRSIGCDVTSSNRYRPAFNKLLYQNKDLVEGFIQDVGRNYWKNTDYCLFYFLYIPGVLTSREDLELFLALGTEAYNAGIPAKAYFINLLPFAGIDTNKQVIKEGDDLFIQVKEDWFKFSSFVIEFYKSLGQNAEQAWLIPRVTVNNPLVKSFEDMQEMLQIIKSFLENNDLSNLTTFIDAFDRPSLKKIIKNTKDLKILAGLIRELGEFAPWILSEELHRMIKTGGIKNSEDLYKMTVIASMSKGFQLIIFSDGFRALEDSGLCSNTNDLYEACRVFIEIARKSGWTAAGLEGQNYCSAVISEKLRLLISKKIIRNTKDLREVCLLLLELAKRAGSPALAQRALTDGLTAANTALLLKSKEDLPPVGAVLVEIAKKAEDFSEVIFNYLDEYIMTTPVLRKKAQSLGGFKAIAEIFIDLHNMAGKKYTDVFFKNKDFLNWYIQERLAGKTVSLEDALIAVNELKFPGYKREFYAKMDPRISKIEHESLASELLAKARYGRAKYKEWYEEYNKERIQTLAEYGIDVDLWLGKKRFKYKNVKIDVQTVEEKEILSKRLPQLKDWLNALLDTVNDPRYVLAEIISHLPKKLRENSVEALMRALQQAPKAIPDFIREVVFKVVKKKPELTSIPAKELRKMIKVFYGKTISTCMARGEAIKAQEARNEVKLISLLEYDKLIERLPKFKVYPYIQTRLSEFARASPKPGKEADCNLAVHHLEEVAQAIANLIQAQDKEYKAHFEGTYDLRFRISDKFPTEVLTIGADGHACIQPGEESEEEGHNFFRDVDALFVEILAMREKKAPIIRMFKKFDRLGFILAFAAVNEKNQPVLALNTVEIPKLWPEYVCAKFFDAATDWLKIFTSNAGFKAIIIGQGHGSDYFRKKYGEQDVYIKKMSPYPTDIEYYTNAFEKGKIRETKQGLILEYSGKGAIIWSGQG
ncbi:hypothetical protein GF343_01085 [Candidatus Woesearchaeota archaeon]|nr:hypothetical protein [Candidatus Woesearchaeota archaeon]